MRVNVTKVTLPTSRWGSIAYGEGTTDDGTPVKFCGELRMLAAIDEALTDGPIEAEIEAWQVRS